MKKAQVTMFIIIGVVALFMAGFMLYYVGLQVKKPAASFDDVTPVTTFVNECIETLSDDAFELAGLQAGLIFTTQGGRAPNFEEEHRGTFYQEREGQIVPSLVMRPRGGDGEPYYSTEVPNYPWKYFPYEKSNNPQFSQAPDYYGYFGRKTLPLLHKSQGPLSIQEQMESYITAKMKTCTAGFVHFPEFTITEKDVSTSVTFADDNTIINMSYPLQIKKKTGQTTTTVSEFIVKKEVRMKKIYEVADWIIDKDVSDVTYDIKQPGMFYGMDIAVEAVDTNQNVGSFVAITDPFSVVKGDTYVFTFTRQNRHPALEFVKVSDLNNIPSGCDFDDKNGVMDCSYVHLYRCDEWSDSICPSCEECNPDRYIPTQLRFDRSTFKEFGFDPDEDVIDSTSFSYIPQMPKSFPGSEYPYNEKIRIIISDKELEDWQEITVNAVWIPDRSPCESRC